MADAGRGGGGGMMGDEGGEKKERGFCMSCIGRIWRLPADKAASENDQELMIKQKFKELMIYLVFLIACCTISLMMTSNNMFIFTEILKELFVFRSGDGDEGDQPSFESINTVEMFWKYAQTVLLSGLYWEKWYNDEPHKEGLIYYENMLLGPPRLRQVRVKTNSCEVNAEFKNFISECYAEFSNKQEDTADIRQDKSNSTAANAISKAWKYRSEDELEGYETAGELFTYRGGGYAIDLKQNKEETEKILKTLSEEKWIRRGGRAIFLNFNIYNANINLFCIVTLFVEFPATGGAKPNWHFDTVKLIRYHNTCDLFVLAIEIFFMLMVIYYAVEEIIELFSIGWRYILSFWNVLDAAIIIFSVICMVLDIYRYQEVEVLMEKFRKKPKEYLSFEFITSIEMHFSHLFAILIFLAWVKTFKYISFNKTMTQLYTTLRRCAKDLLGFLIMFAIVFVAFTQLGYLLFGTQVKDFSTFLNSFFTLFRIILGDFDFHQLEQANRILGPMFFMLFVFFVFFVLINMFLAIINDTYSEVKSDMAKQVDVFIMSDYIKQSYDRFVERFFSKKEKMEVFEAILQTEDSTKRMPVIEFKRELDKKGYEKAEVEAVFMKFDVDIDRHLDPTESEKLIKDLERTRIIKSKERDHKRHHHDEDSDSEDDHPKDIFSKDDMTALKRRVDRLDGTLSTILANVDVVLASIRK